jgi:hypothetical protein
MSFAFYSDPERSREVVAEVLPPPPPPAEKRPGLKLELVRVGTLLDEARMTLADANLANEQDMLASLEATFDKLIGLCTHARKTTTALRVHERQLRSKE